MANDTTFRTREIRQFNTNKCHHVWKNTAWVVSRPRRMQLSLVVNVTDKVVRSCCRPVVPRLTGLTDLFDTFQKNIHSLKLHIT